MNTLNHLRSFYFFLQERLVPVSDSTVVRSLKDSLVVDIAVIVDKSFKDWIRTLEDRGDYLGADFYYNPQAGSECWIGSNRIEKYEYVVPFPCPEKPFLETVIADEIQAANAIFEQNPALAMALGKPLNLNLIEVLQYDFNKKIAKDEEGNYSLRTLLPHLKRMHGRHYPSKIIMAFTGSGLEDSKDRGNYFTQTNPSGSVSHTGERYIVITKDIFLNMLPKGALTAHEVCHALGAIHCEQGTNGEKRLMKYGLRNTGIVLDPENIQRMARYITTHTSHR